MESDKKSEKDTRNFDWKSVIDKDLPKPKPITRRTLEEMYGKGYMKLIRG